MKLFCWIVVFFCFVGPAIAQQNFDKPTKFTKVELNLPKLPQPHTPKLPKLPGTKDCHGVPIPVIKPCPDLPKAPKPIDLFSVPDEKITKILEKLPEADRHKFFIGCLLSTTQCSQMKHSISAKELGGIISKDLSNRLATAAVDWQRNAPWCSEGTEPFPSFENNGQCEDGDMTLFNGLLCSVGIEQGCDAVRRSQNPKTGQWFRSPKRAIEDVPGSELSEEQTWGVFLYLLQKQDRSAFEKWVSWIENDSRPCWTKVGNDCVAPGLPQWCLKVEKGKDGACNFLPYECVIFEVLASRFYSDPTKVVQVSHRLGCDMVMGAIASAPSILGPTLGGISGIVPAVAGEVALHPELVAVISNQANLDNLKNFKFPTEVISRGNSPVLQNLTSLPLPELKTRKVCADDLPVRLPLPDNLRPNACVDIPTPRLPSIIDIPQLPVGERFFTAAYPVQTQVLAQAAISDPSHESWYAWHKVAVQIYLLRLLGLGDDQLNKAASLVAQGSPRNPYFSYIKSGQIDEVASLTLELCPKVGQPRIPNPRQWSWQRWDGEEAWRESNYWECIYIAKLLTDVTVDVTGPSADAH